MHTYNRNALRGSYFKQMRQAAAGRPCISRPNTCGRPTFNRRSHRRTSECVFYSRATTYFSDILFSSNKMAEYMAVGLPIVCSPIPG
jgi:hypothetical protein